VEFEAEARRISTFELSVIPGLLQTPAYARALQQGWLLEDVDRLVTLRVERQKILAGGDPPRLWAIIDENAVTRSFGPAEASANSSSGSSTPSGSNTSRSRSCRCRPAPIRACPARS
jgi:hypothetical protein